MSERTILLPPHLQDGKAATKALIRAYGGQEAAAELTGKAQSRLSAYGHRNTADFAPIDVIAALEGSTHGTAGHPLVTRWLAREAGYLLVPRPNAEPGADWGRKLKKLGAHSGEVLRSICAALGDAESPGAVTAEEVRDGGLVEKLDDLAETVARMRALAEAAVDA